MNQIATITAAGAREVVYFARGHYGQIKIGHTTDLARRISQLQTGSGDKITVIRTIDGGRYSEKWLHKKFASNRVRGEWFEFHQEMMTVIPPDEILPRQVVVTTRDVKLTIKERLRDAERAGRNIGLSDKLILLSFISSLTDEQAVEILDYVAARRSAAA